MEFTYFVAAFLSPLIGFVGAVIFVLVNGRSYRKLLASVLAGAVVADFAFLLDWSRADEMTVELLLTDLAFFAGYGFAACVIGALPGARRPRSLPMDKASRRGPIAEAGLPLVTASVRRSMRSGCLQS